MQAKQITSGERWLIIFAVMSATIMQVLDTTIVNVALPHMQGSLSAAPDQISWTLTSYMVSSAIFMPLTGYLSDRLGQKKYLLICIAGFTATSALCGAASSLVEIILFRILQGALGAGLVPLSQAIINDLYSPSEKNKGAAIWGMGIMLAPILGPTLGGYITDMASWRWTFYVNVPLGVVSFLFAWRVVPDSVRKQRHMDWIGLLMISVAIGAAQYVLDRGSQVDWYNSNAICIATVLAIGGLLGFLLYALPPQQRMVFDLRIFADRNFTVSCLLLGLLGLGLYGGMVLLPLLLENLLNYPVTTTGLIMAPRGLSSMLSILIAGKMMDKMGPVRVILLGAAIAAGGTWLSTFYFLGISPSWIMWFSIIQGFGLGMMFVPVSTVAFATLPMQMRTEAAGLFSLVRVLGGSIGISIAMSLLTKYGQVFWNQLGGFINPYNSALPHYLANLQSAPPATATAVLTGELYSQAQMLAFINVFAIITWTFLAMLPLAFLLKRGKNLPSRETLAVD